MRKSSVKLEDEIDRILDANINRLKEGLRVCEEVCRFILDNRGLTAKFKALRHAVDPLALLLNRPARLISSRRTEDDVGKGVHSPEESQRDSCSDILFANIQRVKESLRVLEEFGKLKDKTAAAGFKQLRYRIYELEKRSVVALSALCDNRQRSMQ